ncbi:MAG: hypothetical protein GY716_13565 [bacterium]|nr:hypothetical protein [bacterium]
MRQDPNALQRVLVIVALAMVATSSAWAQPFVSGSDESDGALNLTIAQHGASFDFDPASFAPPLDTDGDNIYHFTTISVEAGMTVRFSSDILGSLPVQWLATGNVQIDGTLDFTGDAGHDWNDLRVPTVAGAGGFNGGVSSTATTGWSPGLGPGASDFPGGGAAHASGGAGWGSTYGNAFLLPLIGGSGGSGANDGNDAAGGGAGGGALLIAGSGNITVDGAIDTDGGCPGNSRFGQSDETGGGGSSGAIRLIANSIDGTGNLFARQVNCPEGRDPRRGRIRLESYATNFTGSDPTASLGLPGNVFPPATAPTIRITAVDGVPVPANPTGIFPPADVSINDPVAVTIDIEAAYIPLFTTVAVRLLREDGSFQTVTSTPLNGVLETSTATASVVFPPGFTSILLEANWTP